MRPTHTPPLLKIKNPPKLRLGAVDASLNIKQTVKNKR